MILRWPDGAAAALWPRSERTALVIQEATVRELIAAHAVFGDTANTAIDATQRDAAQVLGLKRIDIYRFVVLPQAIRIVLPPVTTTIMLLIKGTSLASAIGTMELMRVGQLVSFESFRPFEVLTAVAVIYFALTCPVAIGARYLERKMGVGEY